MLLIQDSGVSKSMTLAVLTHILDEIKWERKMDLEYSYKIKTDILSFTHLIATYIKSDHPALSVCKNENRTDLMGKIIKLIFHSSF